MLIGLVQCGSGDRSSPGLAKKYDVVIAWCERRLQSTQDMCDRVASSRGNYIAANVLFGKAGGHRVSVEVEVVDGGSRRETPAPDAVPRNRTWLHGVEITRKEACDQSTCRLVARAFVDGLLVLDSDFRFS